MGSGPDINYPAQPSYGEGMADAMKAQMEQLLGQGEYAQMYADAGFAGGDLGDIITEVEGPIRKKTANVENDVLQETLLGGPDYGQYVKDNPDLFKLFTDERIKLGTNARSIEEFGEEHYDVFGRNEGRDVPRVDYGMVDLLGDSRNVVNSEDNKSPREKINQIYQNIVGRDADAYGLNYWSQRIDNPSDMESLEDDLLKERAKKLQAGQDVPAYTKGSYKDLFDRQAGFDSAGNFLGLSALAEDIQRGNLSRQREADLADVERLSDRYSDVMDEFRPGTQQALTDASAVLDSQKNNLTGAGSITTPSGSTYGGDVAAGTMTAATVGAAPGLSASTSYNPSASVKGGTFNAGTSYTASQVADPMALTAATSYTPSASVTGDGYTATAGLQGGNVGADSLRAALLADAEKSLTQGLTDREKANISNAARARSGLMGRTFDQSGAIAEAQALVAEDNNRRMQNRAFAGDTLGRESDIQRADLDRGFQASMQNQDALNRAAEFGASQDMQAQLANQAATNQALSQELSAGLSQEALAAQQAQAKAMADATATNRASEFGVSAGLEQEARKNQADLQAQLANQQATNQAKQFGVGAGMEQDALRAQLGQQTSLAQAQMDQQAAAFDADAAQRASQVNQAQKQQANQFGVGATMDAQRLNEQLKQAGTLGYIDAATRLASLEDQYALDPFAAILGRASGGSLQAGQGVFGQAGYGLNSGPQYLNPEAGLGYISQMATNDANMYAAQQSANASRSAGLMGGLGAIGGGLLGNTSLFCWVAREVYGHTNPAWLQFREWMFTESPNWFFKLYAEYGERFANWISDKPRIKSIIRKWMDSKIGG
jgi:hypothetical protein